MRKYMQRESSTLQRQLADVSQLLGSQYVQLIGSCTWQQFDGLVAFTHGARFLV